ncbi:hypothetical protein E2C01_038668 [Portunus trituberculatus]|uniref:Uncharacterized protein n=1 Tax=Portunus trituberculatus TaxID=210409 RepID=A0A5B7FHF0_PORTR|nr:hypothetical protein [Portunus trituberculatus]
MLCGCGVPLAARGVAVLALGTVQALVLMAVAVTLVWGYPATSGLLGYEWVERRALQHTLPPRRYPTRVAVGVTPYPPFIYSPALPNQYSLMHSSHLFLYLQPSATHHLSPQCHADMQLQHRPTTGVHRAGPHHTAPTHQYHNLAIKTSGKLGS